MISNDSTPVSLPLKYQWNAMDKIAHHFPREKHFNLGMTLPSCTLYFVFGSNRCYCYLKCFMPLTLRDAAQGWIHRLWCCCSGSGRVFSFHITIGTSITYCGHVNPHSAPTDHSLHIVKLELWLFTYTCQCFYIYFVQMIVLFLTDLTDKVNTFKSNSIVF